MKAITIKQLNAIKKSLSGFHVIEWIETVHAIGGIKIKADVLTQPMINIMEEQGFKLRYAQPYTLDLNYVMAVFEPKEIKA